MEDYRAALDYVRGSDLSGLIDPSRVALWGTSFAGGHVLNVAATDLVPDHVGSVRAVVSQVGWCDAVMEGGDTYAVTLCGVVMW